MGYRDGGIPRVVETPANYNGTKMISTVEQYVGVTESPALSNKGSPHINRWKDNFHLESVEISAGVGVPWSGCFAASMFLEAEVDDEGVGDPNIVNIWNRGEVLGLTTTIPAPGCYVIFGEWDSSGRITAGHHVEIFLRWHHPHQREIVCVGGNVPVNEAGTNDGVVVSVRSILRPTAENTDVRIKFVVPRSLTVFDPTLRKADPRIHPSFEQGWRLT
jgi:hypothetical protein